VATYKSFPMIVAMIKDGIVEALTTPIPWKIESQYKIKWYRT
jgi:hypothetical protein